MRLVHTNRTVGDMLRQWRQRRGTSSRAHPAREAEADRNHPGEGVAEVAIPLRLRLGPDVLVFLGTTTVFGTATDVMLCELVVEAFFPADEATAARLRTPAASLDGTGLPQDPRDTRKEGFATGGGYADHRRRIRPADPRPVLRRTSISKFKTEPALWLLTAHPDSWELPPDLPRSSVAEALPLGLIRPGDRKGRLKLTEKGYASGCQRLSAG